MAFVNVQMYDGKGLGCQFENAGASLESIYFVQNSRRRLGLYPIHPSHDQTVIMVSALGNGPLLLLLLFP